MTENSNDAMRRWVDTWKRAGEALESVRERELREFDFKSNLPLLDEMLNWACRCAVPKMDSGLVEQQRYFSKWHKLNS